MNMANMAFERAAPKAARPSTLRYKSHDISYRSEPAVFLFENHLSRTDQDNL